MKLRKLVLIASLWTSAIGISGAMMVLAGFYLYLSPKLPSVESIRDYKLQTPLKVYTQDGKLIDVFGEKRRKPIEYDDIPRQFIDALIATEDENFYSHPGVSLKGLLRAVYRLILTGRKGPGGSTLTMQLTRHTFLTLKQTFSRKFNEILLAMRIEKELSKEEILELYVNLMYLGKRAYGIEAAAEVYYGKSIGELNLAQHAMIVGVFKGPSVQNPIADPVTALERRNYVLARMKKLDYISEDAYSEAIAQPVTAGYHGHKTEVEALYVAEMARKKAIELFGTRAYTDGYSVYTTIKSDLQLRANDAIAKGLMDYDNRHGYRGPEQQFSLDDAPEFEAVDEDELSPSRDYSAWLESLSSIPAYGGLEPAVVTTLHDDETTDSEAKRITVLLKEGQFVDIPWENGLSNARPYLSEDARGPSPKTLADVVRVGDVIRTLQKDDGTWQFSQVPAAQASLVSLAPSDGAILSLVGGFDFRHSNFNRAIQAERQPGSNFKPFVYTAALENGLTPATLINDAPIVFDDKQLESTWRPVNDSKKFYGPTRLREALYRSINLVSIRVLDAIGINNAVNSLEKFGFSADDLPKDLSLALGSHAITPLEVASGYAIFANGGYRVEPFVVKEIRDFDNETVYYAKPNTVCKTCDIATMDQSPSTFVDDIDDPYALNSDPFLLSFATKRALRILTSADYPRAPKVLSDEIAFIIDSMLKDVVRRGTGVKAWRRFQRTDIGGKTGTTNGPLDVWFSGYHPNIATSTWVGFDQNLPLGVREYGTSAALPIWMDFMELALQNEPVVNPTQPPGVVSVKIDPETGMRAKVGDPDATFEVFLKENVPELVESDIQNPWDSEENISSELF